MHIEVSILTRQLCHAMIDFLQGPLIVKSILICKFKKVDNENINHYIM
jgi:hypothetical protein